MTGTFNITGQLAPPARTPVMLLTGLATNKSYHLLLIANAFIQVQVQVVDQNYFVAHNHMHCKPAKLPPGRCAGQLFEGGGEKQSECHMGGPALSNGQGGQSGS